jgi:hypothetical protein
LQLGLTLQLFQSGVELNFEIGDRVQLNTSLEELEGKA